MATRCAWYMVHAAFGKPPILTVIHGLIRREISSASYLVPLLNIRCIMQVEERSCEGLRDPRPHARSDAPGGAPPHNCRPHLCASNAKSCLITESHGGVNAWTMIRPHFKFKPQRSYLSLPGTKGPNSRTCAEGQREVDNATGSAEMDPTTYGRYLLT